MRIVIGVFLSIGLIFFGLMTGCNEKKPTESEPTQPLEQLTFSGGWYPTVSPDGNWLAYRVAGDGLLKQDLRNDQVSILTSYGTEPDWAHAGNLILFRTVEPLESRTVLAVVNALNGDTSIVRYEGFDDGAVWSYDGDEIAAEGSLGIRLIAYPGGDTSWVTCTDPVDGGCQGENPTWSPDGLWLAFEDGLEIMKVRRTGGAAVQVVGNLNDVTEPTWSPDGDYIAFSMQDSTSTDMHIWVADARGQQYGLWQVTATDTSSTVDEWYDGNPCWSPDSKIIYFESNRSGRHEIWRVGFKP
ncbi:MAG: PD40 domain-containing protein [candidate division Zixibacteria bacterium]|nr:PD40 domain-containing protein [candidate division Zixibacteria bacterium]